jgi:hypothetical protein
MYVSLSAGRYCRRLLSNIDDHPTPAISTRFVEITIYRRLFHCVDACHRHGLTIEPWSSWGSEPKQCLFGIGHVAHTYCCAALPVSRPMTKVFPDESRQHPIRIRDNNSEATA